MHVDELRAQRRSAERLVAEERYAEAVELYRDVLAHDDSHAKSWYGIGYCYYKMGHLDQSRVSMREARRRGYGPAEIMLRRIRERIHSAEGTAEPLVSTPPSSMQLTPPPPPPPLRPHVPSPADSTAHAGEGGVASQALRRLREEQDSLRGRLDRLYLELAPLAETSGACKGWVQARSLHAARAVLEQAVAERRKLREELKARRDDYRARKETALRDLECAAEMLKTPEAALHTAEAQRDAVQREIEAADAGLRAVREAGTVFGKVDHSPITAFEEARAAAAEALPKAEERVRAAQAEYDAVAARVRAGESVWRTERMKYIRDLESCRAAWQTAEAAAAAAKDTWYNAQLELGHAVVGAGVRLPEMAERVMDAEYLLRQLAAVDAQIEEHRASRHRPPAQPH